MLNSRTLCYNSIHYCIHAFINILCHSAQISRSLILLQWNPTKHHYTINPLHFNFTHDVTSIMAEDNVTISLTRQCLYTRPSVGTERSREDLYGSSKDYEEDFRLQPWEATKYDTHMTLLRQDFLEIWNTELWETHQYWYHNRVPGIHNSGKQIV